MTLKDSLILITKVPIPFLKEEIPNSLNLKPIKFGTTNIITNSFKDHFGSSFPLLENDSQPTGMLQQKFSMGWTGGERKEIQYKGLSGTLAGEEGCPGVVYNEAANCLEINLLMSRSDGSFAIVTEKELCMIVAPPTSKFLPNYKEIFFARFTNGVKLPQNYWHSVPFPPPGEDPIELDEYIADTNQNIVVNLLEETGQPMVVNL